MIPGNLRQVVFIFMAMATVISSCYVRTEGCLDTLASNFDVKADDPCGTCCVFPSLMLNIVHNAGDSLLNTKTVYSNKLNQKYQILDIRYYLSDFELKTAGKPPVRIREVIQNASGTVTEYNDMHICRIADNNVKVGTARTFGQFDTLSLYLGLRDKVLTSEFSSLPSDHVLLKNNKLKDETGNTVFATLKYVRVKPDKRDTVNLYFGDLQERFAISIDSTLMTQKGSNITYRLRTDYLKILEDINLDTIPGIIKTMAGRNLKSAIGVR